MQTLTYRHYDSGFDPRFTLDGLSFDIDRYPPTGIVKLFKLLLQHYLILSSNPYIYLNHLNLKNC